MPAEDRLHTDSGLSGRLVSPAARDLSGIEVQFWTTSGAGSYRSAKVAPDGAFRFDPGPVGQGWLLVDGWVDEAGRILSAAQAVGPQERGPVQLALSFGALLHG